jgi:hypothetical protein
VTVKVRFQEEDVTKVPGILASAVLLVNLAISPALAQQQSMRIRGTSRPSTAQC